MQEVKRRLKKGLSRRITYSTTIEISNEKYILTIQELPEDQLFCLNCNSSIQLEKCRNCNYYPSYNSITSVMDDANTCARCKLTHHQSRWICKECQCNNPLNDTIFHSEIENYRLVKSDFNVVTPMILLMVHYAGVIIFSYTEDVVRGFMQIINVIALLWCILFSFVMTFVVIIMFIKSKN